jgi:hypothetical protein
MSQSELVGEGAFSPSFVSAAKPAEGKLEAYPTDHAR